MLAGLSFALPAEAGPCLTNVHNALLNRHLTAPKNECTIDLCNPFLTPQWKRVYTTAYDETRTGAWRIGKPCVKLNRIDDSRRIDLPRHKDIQGHVKIEVTIRPPQKTRLIQGNVNEVTAYEHPDEYATMTRFMKKIKDEPFMINGIHTTFVYGGGLNHNELSDHISAAINRPGVMVYDERDGKNWDATMNQKLLFEEFRVYEFFGLLSAQIFLERCSGSKGRVRVKRLLETLIVKYYTAWKRLSGDWNTSVGNTLISMIIAYTVFSRMPENLRPEAATCYFMGDDYLAVLRYPSQSTIKVRLRDLHNFLDSTESLCGITPERALFLDPLRVTFISLGLWPRHNGGFQFVPHPGKQLAKLFWAKDGRWRKHLDHYTTAISIGCWNTFKGFTLLTNFLRIHYKATNAHAPRTLPGCVPQWVEKVTDTVRDVDWVTGFVFKYDIPYCATLFTLPPYGVWHHPAVDRMIQYELLDPIDRPGAY